MSPMSTYRIGEFSRRVGVSAELLRAWERRYGLLQPVRSAGGFRLYSEEDAERVARMRRALADGMSAAEAARDAARATVTPAESDGGVAATRLLAAIRRYDEDAVQSILDESFAAFGVEAVLRNLIVPALSTVGEEWRAGLLAISQEHFASNLIRGRLLALARLWGRGSGPRALLACVPGEAHDISLLSFGLLLRSYGWRVLFLGADTPIDTVADAVDSIDPALIVLTSFDPALITAQAAALRRLAKRTRLALSGPGTSAAVCARLGAQWLNGDLFTAAERITHAERS
jgi:DNA-binding transcriptional MerR regulator